ncbi:MAG: ATP-binding protein [Myxococcota bacterium]
MAAVLCGWLVMIAVGSWLVGLAEPANVRATMLGPLSLLEARFESIPTDSWEAEAEAQSRAFGYPVRVAPADGLPSYGTVDQAVSDADTRIIAAEHYEGQDTALIAGRRLRDGSFVLVGPIPDEPPPPASLTGALLLLIALVTLGGGVLLTVPLARRMRALATAAADIQAGRFARRAEEGPDDIIGSFARSFNAMASKVEDHIERQEHLLHAVAHELRTPLSRVRFTLEKLNQLGGQGAEHLETIDGDLEEVDELVEELLTYARFGSDRPLQKMDAVDLWDVAHGTLRKLKRMPEDIDITVEGDAPTVYGDRRTVQRVFDNLLGNAVRHANKHVRLQLGARERDGRNFALIRVLDDGEGVAEDQRERIFEPFARVEESRSRRYGGAGLGLAIVRRILEHHGGTVSVDDAPGGGACFDMLWPADCEHEPPS